MKKIKMHGYKGNGIRNNNKNNNNTEYCERYGITNEHKKVRETAQVKNKGKIYERIATDNLEESLLRLSVVKQKRKLELFVKQPPSFRKQDESKRERMRRCEKRKSERSK